MCQGYKRAWCHVVGGWLVQLLLGKEVHSAGMDWRAGVPALREPTSFKYNWLGCFNSSVCVRASGRTITLREWPESAVFFLREYCLCRTVVPFGWCPCALFIELLFTSLEAYHRCGDTPYFHVAYVTIFGIPGWAPTETTWVARFVNSVPPRLWPQVIKCSCGKIGEQWYALIPGGLASWTGTVL